MPSQTNTIGMCGRYAYIGPIGGVRKLVVIGDWDWLPDSNYNISPTQEVPVLLKEREQIHIRHLHWGLIPFWAKDPKIGSRMINARSETLAEKPSFKNAFKKHRCLVLANGYYEWTGTKGDKQPYFITTLTDEPFGFAGLWETWTDKDSETTIQSCTIITTEASPVIEHIHERMPVILNPEIYQHWLDPELQDLNELIGMLEVGKVEEFKFYPVSRDVNSTRNNRPDLMQPINLQE
ncbi:MAG: SOS response-associated peptidase [Desulfobacterales bacterium]|nr:SOS response-associated peptidase [Desulfobacterales bacterium]